MCVGGGQYEVRVAEGGGVLSKGGRVGGGGQYEVGVAEWGGGEHEVRVAEWGGSMK